MKRSVRRKMSNVYDIVKYPDPILFNRTKSLTKFSKAEALQDYLHEATIRNKGLAVAANQLGLNVSAFFMKVNDKNFFAINPHIADVSMDTCLMDEGCLSIPAVLWHVHRPKELLLQAYDVNGNFFEQEFSGLEARVIFHEIDHLLGIVLPDYLNDELFDLFVYARESYLKNSSNYINFNFEIKAGY
jgi:peptide deformylase